jgi:hypothetical protein
MMLGRTIRLAGGEDISLIKPKWYTRIFVTADVTTLIIQGLGTNLVAGQDKNGVELTISRCQHHGYDEARSRSRW